MANPYFQLKQFTVYQAGAAMKVSTEACILGAWAPVEKALRILDIGTGTGLLALMMAQRSSAFLEAIELDESSARQAFQNVASSPFAGRIRVIQGAIQDVSQHLQPFDRIVSNPPFYHNYLRPEDPGRNLALHAESLSFTDLLDAVQKLLTPDGTFIVVLPPFETEKLLEKAAQCGLFLHRQLTIYPRTESRVFRQISVLGFVENPIERETLIIHQANGQYTTEFIAVLKPYYLKL